MDNLHTKVVLLSAGVSSAPPLACIELLQANGFEVEVWQTLNSPAKLKYKHSANAPSALSKELRLVEKTCDYLNDKLCDKHGLDQLAYNVGSNRSQLASSFKRILGLGVFEWLRAKRMEKAKHLLIHSDFTIQEIGFEVGYENSANFSSAFKKHFGISPKQQRINIGVEILTPSKELLT
ncbi:helix-turn-helix transcriptional regulator [Thalassotalea sp. LPB0316]|uniref:helix-turn-helix transcriptional regulator n=1 Tax=Thalassotalea sp. LPB0316 TaxID=2769490 RepID=UPI001868A2FB|nr:AraC family transcriptional regulator [Thalassotalea sp. LPB0316]QOL25214.1 helix-turn-helix transcriptional regulator [Thalassotalea sp. LPB0316]